MICSIIPDRRGKIIIYENNKIIKDKDIPIFTKGILIGKIITFFNGIIDIIKNSETELNFIIYQEKTKKCDSLKDIELRHQIQGVVKAICIYRGFTYNLVKDIEVSRFFKKPYKNEKKNRELFLKTKGLEDDDNNLYSTSLAMGEIYEKRKIDKNLE